MSNLNYPIIVNEMKDFKGIEIGQRVLQEKKKESGRYIGSCRGHEYVLYFSNLGNIYVEEYFTNKCDITGRIPITSNGEKVFNKEHELYENLARFPLEIFRKLNCKIKFRK